MHLSGFRLTDSVYDDLRFPAQGINPPGAASDPDLESTTGLLLFGTVGTETIADVAQMPHTWKEGTNIIPISTGRKQPALR